MGEITEGLGGNNNAEPWTGHFQMGHRGRQAILGGEQYRYGSQSGYKHQHQQHHLELVGNTDSQALSRPPESESGGGPSSYPPGVPLHTKV